MPSGIEDMYAHMLSNIEQVYRQDAMLLLQMTLEGLTDSLLDVALALHRAFDQLPELSVKQAISFSDATRRKIPTKCVLEVHLDNDDSKIDEGVSFETDEESSGQIS